MMYSVSRSPATIVATVVNIDEVIYIT